mmetsp:Transcript_101332/g.291975  ORF Transcript_101332/g.291975 Transcript_101332/m.291975 type:complete len:528 (-) Transcript_101332:163-1746(-)
MGMKRSFDEVLPSSHGISSVLCCCCGTPMVPNQTMRCAQCLKSEVSIIDGISRQVALPRCRNCGRYSRPPWTKAEIESRELLGVCLKRIKGIGKDVRLVDASFIWTEEHSMRIRVKITVQKEVAAQSVLQQTMVVEFQIVNQQCEECQKSFTPHAWNAVVQVRQKVPHRRTLIMLEQLILKHDAHAKVLSLKQTPEGLDFHFAQRSHAQRFADFVGSCVPQQVKNSKALTSHDASSNVYHYKYTILCELCLVCSDDIVYVPKGHSSRLNGAAPLLLCYKVSNAIRLVDPLTLRSWDVPPPDYFKRPFQTVCHRAHLTEFMVLNVEVLPDQQAAAAFRHHVPGRGKYAVGDVEVVRVQDLGVNDDRYIVRSHLAGLLRPGNHVLGYDLRSVNISGLDSAGIEEQTADFLLVKRQFKSKRSKRRAWELKRMDKTVDVGEEAINDDDDLEAVKKDLEEDPELRKGVNMYRVEQQSAARQTDAAAGEGEEDEEEDDSPEVPLAELLEGLALRDDDPPAGGAGAQVAPMATG